MADLPKFYRPLAGFGSWNCSENEETNYKHNKKEYTYKKDKKWINTKGQVLRLAKPP